MGSDQLRGEGDGVWGGWQLLSVHADTLGHGRTQRAWPPEGNSEADKRSSVIGRVPGCRQEPGSVGMMLQWLIPGWSMARMPMPAPRRCRSAAISIRVSETARNSRA